MAAPRVNLFLAPTYQRRARGWIGRKYRFSSLQYDPTGPRTQPISTTNQSWRGSFCPNGTSYLCTLLGQLLKDDNWLFGESRKI